MPAMPRPEEEEAEVQPLIPQRGRHDAGSRSSIGAGCSGQQHHAVTVLPPQQQHLSFTRGASASDIEQGNASTCSSSCAGHSSAGGSTSGGGDALATGEPRTCRICFEGDDGDPSNPLISPCLCSGSSRFVHRQCLAQWRETGHRQDACWQCEVCKVRAGRGPVLGVTCPFSYQARRSSRFGFWVCGMHIKTCQLQAGMGDQAGCEVCHLFW